MSEQQALANTVTYAFALIILVGVVVGLFWKRFSTRRIAIATSPTSSATATTYNTLDWKRYAYSWPSVVIFVVITLIIAGYTFIEHDLFGLIFLGGLYVVGYDCLHGGGRWRWLFTVLYGGIAFIAIILSFLFGFQGANTVVSDIQTENLTAWEEDRLLDRLWPADPPPPTAAPPEPIRYHHGMTLNLRPGESLLILLAGEIRMVNYDRGHCMSFAPASHVKRVWNHNFTVAQVSPAGAPEREVQISKLRPGEEDCPG